MDTNPYFSKHSFRPYRRVNDQLVVMLSLEEWPEDTPLPKQAALAHVGDGPLPPLWVFDLREDKTVEIVMGTFDVPQTAAFVSQWYQQELRARGWNETSDPSALCGPTTFSHQFEHPSTEVRIRLSILTHPRSHNARFHIWRGTLQPWARIEPLDASAYADEPRPQGSEAGGSLAQQAWDALQHLSGMHPDDI